MDNIAGFQRCLCLHSHQSEIEKVPQVLSREESLSVHIPPLRAGHSSSRVYQNSQGGETDGTGTGYPDPAVSRRLVSQSPVPPDLPTAYPDPLGLVPQTRVGDKHEQIGAYTPTGFQFCRLLVQSSVRSGSTHSGQIDHPTTETFSHQRAESFFGQAVHVLNSDFLL